MNFSVFRMFFSLLRPGIAALRLLVKNSVSRSASDNPKYSRLSTYGWARSCRPRGSRLAIKCPRLAYTWIRRDTAPCLALATSPAADVPGDTGDGAGGRSWRVNNRSRTDPWAISRVEPPLSFSKYFAHAGSTDA